MNQAGSILRIFLIRSHGFPSVHRWNESWAFGLTFAGVHVPRIIAKMRIPNARNQRPNNAIVSLVLGSTAIKREAVDARAGLRSIFSEKLCWPAHH